MRNLPGGILKGEQLVIRKRQIHPALRLVPVFAGQRKPCCNLAKVGSDRHAYGTSAPPIDECRGELP
ncbi:MAG: hypothetical protein KC482_03765, partial [Dehalococcoidia bacterium]|nr:hypothetical protein [Dehalococcoidia bacterium]